MITVGSPGYSTETHHDDGTAAGGTGLVRHAGVSVYAVLSRNRAFRLVSGSRGRGVKSVDGAALLEQ